MDKLLLKYFTDSLSDEEKAILFQELESNPSLREEFIKWQNVTTLSDVTIKKSDSQWVSGKIDELENIVQKRKINRLFISLAKYAAVAILVSCVWFVGNLYIGKHKEIAQEFTMIEVPKGQTVYITLPDETKVWLSSRSKLKFSNQFNKSERIIELDGEGFFSVSKNTDMPFIVDTKTYDIKVTGTQFNVFAYSESSHFETDLVEGSVSVYNNGLPEDKAIRLQPNEGVSFDGEKLIKSRSTFVSTHLIDGIYSFENMPFRDLQKRLELWYNIRFNIEKEEILAYKFSGKFNKSDDIERILNAIKETGKFNFRIEEDATIDIY
ncbi:MULTISPECIES: FecR family protein [unclassified Parabacteroides]|uniref:FecR family protein n=1 Tax=unclassified Parabacteroides TaxID=2649774 RepID=UPI00247696A2|nr:MULTISPECIES: FecR family protein [unclassified Parabacteroides]